MHVDSHDIIQAIEALCLNYDHGFQIRALSSAGLKYTIFPVSLDCRNWGGKRSRIADSLDSHVVLHFSQRPHDIHRVCLACRFLYRWILEEVSSLIN